MECSILPLGMLAEEASESRNKNYKNYREFHSRGHSRKARLEDVFMRAMDTSDPQISSRSLRSRINKNGKMPLPPAVIDLLALPEISTQTPEIIDDEEITEYPDEEINDLELDCNCDL